MKINQKIQAQYSTVEGLYWMFAAAAFGFLTPVLKAKGYSDIDIGSLTAVKCVSNIFSQILITIFADRRASSIQLKYIIDALLLIGTAVTMAFYVCPSNMLVGILVFLAFGATINCIEPLIESIAIQFMNHGQHFSYTAARACGSFTWAVISIAIGVFADGCGAKNILLLEAGLAVLLFVAITAMEKVDLAYVGPKTERKPVKKEPAEEKVHTVWYLLRHYPNFTVFLLGTIFATLSYNMGNCFLIDVVRRAGGNNTHLGICEFVLAISEIPTAMLFMKMRRRLNLEKLLVVFTVSNTLKTAGTIFTNNIYVVIGSQAFEMLGFGLFYFCTIYFVRENLPQTDVVKANSLVAVGMTGIGASLGSAASGVIKTNLGLTSLLIIGTACGVLSTVVMATNLRRPKCAAFSAEKELPAET